jgi:molybdopterin molybdotransferase
MDAPRRLIEFAAARALVRERLAARTLPACELAVDACLGHVLAQDVAAPHAIPGFAHSAMDGYAVRHADLAPDAPTRLACAGVMLAGTATPRALGPRECVRITTGTPLPDGADTVVIKENARVEGDVVELAPGTAQGANVRAADDDFPADAPALVAGTRVGAAQVAVAHAFGRTRLCVRRRPRVAILSTGDELVPAGAALGYGQRHDSNGPMLAALAVEHGCDVILREHVADDPVALGVALALAAADSDLVLTSGGVSAGEADHVPTLVARDGEIVFWKVRMRPGMPALFGFHGATPLLALPGNPVSVFATFVAFARPALAALTGCAALDPAPRRAVLEAPLDKKHDRLELRRVRTDCDDDGRLVIRAHPNLSSGALRSVLESDALAELAADGKRFEAGARLPVYPLRLPC